MDFSIVFFLIFIVTIIYQLFRIYRFVRDIKKLTNIEIEKKEERKGKNKASHALAQWLDTDPPEIKKGDGGTITRPWLKQIYRLIKGESTTLKKQDIIRELVHRKHKKSVEEFLPSGKTGGATVTGDAIWLVYDTQTITRKKRIIRALIFLFISLVAFIYLIWREMSF